MQAMTHDEARKHLAKCRSGDRIRVLRIGDEKPHFGMVTLGLGKNYPALLNSIAYAPEGDETLRFVSVGELAAGNCEVGRVLEHPELPTAPGVMWDRRAVRAASYEQRLITIREQHAQNLARIADNHENALRAMGRRANRVMIAGVAVLILLDVVFLWWVS